MSLGEDRAATLLGSPDDAALEALGDLAAFWLAVRIDPTVLSSRPFLEEQRLLLTAHLVRLCQFQAAARLSSAQSELHSNIQATLAFVLASALGESRPLAAGTWLIYAAARSQRLFAALLQAQPVKDPTTRDLEAYLASLIERAGPNLERDIDLTEIFGGRND